MEYLIPDHDPDRVTLPDTPRSEQASHNPKDPLYAIYGQDPRRHASKAAGEAVVREIVGRLTAMIQEALSGKEN